MGKSRNHNQSYEANIKKRRKHHIHISTKGRNLLPSTIRNESRKSPAVELSTLCKILKVVVESRDHERVIKLILHDKNFFRKLMDWFRVCEDLENREGLHMIYKIVKGIILLNSREILQKVSGDELVMDIMGSLEYDMETPHVNHRNFLKEHVVFKEPIPIEDPLVLSKIHQTYRIRYLMDVVLPKVLDKAAVSTLESIIRSNNKIVVTILTDEDDSTFIKDLFARLKSPTTSPDSKRNLVYFLYEFCCLIKSLFKEDVTYYFRCLVIDDLYGAVTEILQSEDKKLALIGARILSFSVCQDPTLLHDYVGLENRLPLLGLLVKGMLTDSGDDMHHFLEIIEGLLYYHAPPEQRDVIFEIFYERHLDQLISVITSSCKIINGNHGFQASAKPEILLTICDLLCFCVLHHPCGIKCNFLLNGVLDKVLYLTRRREKYLIAAAVRFIRALISHNDEHVASYIAKNNTLRPVIDAFISNGSRYNLLHSAVLELFDHIRKENLKIVLKYIVETFWGQLVKFDSLPSIQSLKVTYDQTQKEEDSSRRVEERDLEKEEGYLVKDSDHEDSASAATLCNTQTHTKPPPPKKDNDDEDYKPPPIQRSDHSLVKKPLVLADLSNSSLDAVPKKGKKKTLPT